MSKIIVCDHCHDPISESWVDVCPTCYAAMKKALEDTEAEQEEKAAKPSKKAPAKKSKARPRKGSHRGQVGILKRAYRIVFGNP